MQSFSDKLTSEFRLVPGWVFAGHAHDGRRRWQRGLVLQQKVIRETYGIGRNSGLIMECQERWEDVPIYDEKENLIKRPTDIVEKDGQNGTELWHSPELI